MKRDVHPFTQLVNGVQSRHIWSYITITTFYCYTFLCVIATDPNRKEAARRLVSRGAEVDAKDEAGKTPLHVAASMNNTEGVDLLTDEAGADVNARDNEGRSPLLVALDHNFETLSEDLLRKGADIYASDVRGLVSKIHKTFCGFR